MRLSIPQREALLLVHEAVMDAYEVVVATMPTAMDRTLETAFVNWRTAESLERAGLVRLIDKRWGRHEATAVRLTLKGMMRVLHEASLDAAALGTPAR